MTTKEDETNCLPFTVRRTPGSTSANVIVLGERDTITGAGRALPHKGLSALQPGKTSTSRSAQKALIRFIRHRTPCGPQKLRRPTTDTFGHSNRCAHHRPLSVRAEPNPWPLRFSVVRLLTFLLVSLDSQHIATDRWASLPTYPSNAHDHREACLTRCPYL